ncbi:MAG TPA: MbcA/ParS/Xre antitoxin family protein [Polyangiaceae bacterium]|nr:MbcA/ParS/Xre antitoxin family protein [Polyangiaceae bacterium]
MSVQPSSEQRIDLADSRTSAVAKKTFFRIMDLWGATNEQAQVLLGSPSRSTFFSWKKGEGGNLSRDAFERISYVMGIYKALQILFADAPQADAWVSKPNAAFGGRSALDRMAAGNIGDLHAVRAYLDYARGGGS